MKKIRFLGILVVLLLFLLPTGNIMASADSEEDHKRIVDQLKFEIDSAKNVPSPEIILEQEKVLIDSQINHMLYATPLSLDKWLYRYQLSRWSEALIDAGLPMSGAFLFHSLQDEPSELVYEAGEGYSNTVKNSEVIKNFIKSFRSELPSSGNYYSKTGSLTLDKPVDVYLSLNKVSYIAGAEKINGSWKVYLRLYDTYDFEHQNYTTSNGVPSAFVTWVNNHAADAQEAGAIVPYSITIYMQD